MAPINWLHSIDLGNGVISPGKINTIRHLPRFRLPESFAGLTVLDVGACDGFYSFEAKRRGAARVVALDRWGGPSGLPIDGFNTARDALGLNVENITADLMDLPKLNLGRFDVVLFLGVLYHLRDPWGAIRAVADTCRGMMVLETHVDLLSEPRPAVAFYSSGELADDPSNHCGPNPAAIELMLKDSGFARVEPISLLHYPQPGEAGVWEFLDGGKTPADIVRRDIRPDQAKIASVRMVYHAFKS